MNFSEIKRRYLIIQKHLSSDRATDLTEDEQSLLDKYAPIDIHGWLIGELTRLRAQLEKADALADAADGLNPQGQGMPWIRLMDVLAAYRESRKGHS